MSIFVNRIQLQPHGTVSVVSGARQVLKRLSPIKMAAATKGLILSVKRQRVNKMASFNRKFLFIYCRKTGLGKNVILFRLVTSYTDGIDSEINLGFGAYTTPVSCVLYDRC